MSRLGSLVLDVGRLRHHRDLRLLMVGQLISGMGRQITLVALPYQLYVLTHSPLAIGAGFVCRIGSCSLIEVNGGSVSNCKLSCVPIMACFPSAGVSGPAVGA